MIRGLKISSYLRETIRQLGCGIFVFVENVKSFFVGVGEGFIWCFEVVL